MKFISPCHEMFECVNRFDDKELCEDICDHLKLYRSHLNKYKVFERCSEKADINPVSYNPTFKPSFGEGHIEDPYSSLLAQETILFAQIEAEESKVDEAIDTSFGRPLYSSFYKGEVNV